MNGISFMEIQKNKKLLHQKTTPDRKKKIGYKKKKETMTMPSTSKQPNILKFLEAKRTTQREDNTTIDEHIDRKKQLSKEDEDKRLH